MKGSGKTIRNIIFENLKDKYFQHVEKPENLICNINSFISPFGTTDDAFLGYSPVLDQEVYLWGFELSKYVEISEKEFKKQADFYKQNKLNLSASEIESFNKNSENILKIHKKAI